MKKFLLYGAAGLAILGAAGGFFAYVRLGSIVKAAVETFGPKLTKAEVRVGLVTLSPFSGSGQVRSVFIGNPAGFKTPSAFELGSVRVGVDLKSLASDKIVVREIVIEGPEITFEGTLSGSNLGRIQENVESFVPAGNSSAKSGPAPKVVIGLFRVTGGKVKLSLAGLAGKSVTVPLPDIELRDIGKSSGGVSPAKAAREMFGAVTRAAIKAAAGAGALLKGGAGAAVGVGKSAVGTVKGLFRKKK